MLDFSTCCQCITVNTEQYSPIAPLRTNSLSLQRLCGIEWTTEVNIFYWRVSTHQSWHLYCTTSCYTAASTHNVCVVQTYWMVSVEAATEPRGLADNMDQSGDDCVEGFERQPWAQHHLLLRHSGPRCSVKALAVELGRGCDARLVVFRDYLVC